MAEIICPGTKTSESEFQIVPATSTHPAAQLTAACGPNAASSAARWASQSATAPTTVDVYRHMRSLGLGGSNGLSDLNELQKTLADMGYTVERPKSGESVQQFLDRQAGHAAVVWETANGQALRDLISGMGEDATNLQRHILCLFGKKTDSGPSAFAGGKVLPPGYWCADGDNDSQNTKDGVRYHWPINQRLCYYAASDVVKAQPIDALAVLPKEVVTVGVPQGWHDDGKTLTAPNGVPVVQGFRDKVLAWPGGWASNNTPLAAERAITSGSVEYANRYAGPGSRQDFRFCTLCWTQHAGVYVMAIGQDVVWLAQQLAAAQAQVAALQKQLANMPPPDAKAAALVAAIRAVLA